MTPSQGCVNLEAKVLVWVYLQGSGLGILGKVLVWVYL